MSKNSISENFPNHFQRESLNLINGLLPLSSSGFYLAGADMFFRRRKDIIGVLTMLREAGPGPVTRSLPGNWR